MQTLDLNPQMQPRLRAHRNRTIVYTAKDPTLVKMQTHSSGVLQDFLSGEADLDGADIGSGLFGGSPSQGGNAGDDAVELDEQELWREMQKILRVEEEVGGMQDSSEGESFYGEYSDDDWVPEGLDWIIEHAFPY